MCIRPVQNARLAAWTALALWLAAAGCAQLESFSLDTREPREAGRRDTRREAAAAPRAARRAAAPAGWTHYVVRPGDTVGKIAACRGISVGGLARANGLANPNRVLAGQHLRVPAADACSGVAASEPRFDVLLGEPDERPSAGAPAETEVGAAPRDVAASAPSTREEQARALLTTARLDYEEARFEEALAGAEAATRELAPTSTSASATALRARGYLLAGMAAAALDRRERASALFGAAFALEPELDLHEDEASPRILEIVDEAVPGATRRPR